MQDALCHPAIADAIIVLAGTNAGLFSFHAAYTSVRLT
jgi:hypothetical protein